MRFFTTITAVCAAMALGLTLTATAPNTQVTEQSEPSPVAAMLELSMHGTGVDFDPFFSGSEAVRQSDLIVTGTLVDVVEGVRVVERGPAREGRVNPRDRWQGSDGDADLTPLDETQLITRYFSYIIDVDEVISGDASSLSDRIEVQVLASNNATAAEVAELNTKPSLIVALDRVSGGNFGRWAVAETPDGEVSQGDLYFPYDDLFWFEGEDELLSHYVHPGDPHAQWLSGATSVDALARLLAEEAGG